MNVSENDLPSGLADTVKLSEMLLNFPLMFEN